MCPYEADDPDEPMKLDKSKLPSVEEMDRILAAKESHNDPLVRYLQQRTEEDKQEPLPVARHLYATLGMMGQAMAHDLRRLHPDATDEQILTWLRRM